MTDQVEFIVCWSCKHETQRTKALDQQCAECNVNLWCDRMCSHYQDAECPGTLGLCVMLEIKTEKSEGGDE